MKICVAGVGAVGATIAARLTSAGETVTLLARGERCAQLRRDGLRVEFGAEMFEARLTVSDRPEFGAQDVIFVAVKAQALTELLPTLSPLMGPQTIVAPLVNGIPWWYFQGAGGAFDGHPVSAVDPQGVLRNFIAPERIVGCVVYLTAQLMSSGVVTTMGGQRMAIGEISTGAPDRVGASDQLRASDRVGAPDRVAALTRALSRSGIAATASERIRDDLWTKVALNLATNPLSVVTEATLVDQFTDPKLLPIVTAVIEETLPVAAGHGSRPMMSLDEMIVTGRKAGPFETSMLQDYRAGRPLELDAIGHSVLELAGKIGVLMPTTKLIVDLCEHRAARRNRSSP